MSGEEAGGENMARYEVQFEGKKECHSKEFEDENEAWKFAELMSEGFKRVYLVDWNKKGDDDKYGVGIGSEYVAYWKNGELRRGKRDKIEVS